MEIVFETKKAGEGEVVGFDLRERRRLRSFDLVLETVTFSLNHHRFGMVEHPVQNGRSNGGIVVEDAQPVFIGLVGGEDGRAFFVAAADNLEQEVRARFVDGQIAEFIQKVSLER
jgi:hypothetical protein